MKRRFYRELWSQRFKKMLKLENEAAAEYEKLLEECRSHFDRHPVIPHFERLIADEKRHAGLVEELLRMLARQEGDKPPARAQKRPKKAVDTC